MIKKILYIFTFISLFISFLFNAFAFEANLSLEKEKVDINDYINLKVEISSVEGGEIGITNIKGIDKFDIISQSKTSLLLNLVLKAKNKGDFSIGPAILKRGNEEVKTNIVNVSVSGDKLFLNNNHLNLNTSNSSVKKDEKIIEFNNNKINTFFGIRQQSFLILLLMLTILIVIVLYHNKIIYNNNFIMELEKIEKLEKILELKKLGLLTEKEFNTEKKVILSKNEGNEDINNIEENDIIYTKVEITFFIIVALLIIIFALILLFDAHK